MKSQEETLGKAKMEEKKRTNTIQDNNQEIDRDDDIGQMLVWSMKKPYEQYEKELNENPDTKDLRPSDELFTNIVKELKEQGEWNKKPEPDVPNIYDMLSQEDREALSIGRKIKKINKRTIFMKRAAIVACVAICLFGVSMTSGANRRYMVALWNEIVGDSQLRITMNVEDEENGEAETASEEQAMETIRDELGIQPIEMVYRPEGMEFLNYKIENEDKRALMFYEYQESIFSILMQSKDSNSKYVQEFDGVVVNKISSRISNEKVNIWKIDDNNYAAQLEGKNDYYVLQGPITEKEFTKIIQSITFFVLVRQIK